jgi:hypothetical protein
MKQRSQRAIGPDDSRLSSRPAHGISRVERHAVAREQGHACVICGRLLPLVQDHDHALARTHAHPEHRGCPLCNRALLCDPCNRGLGDFADDPERLRRAALYVEFWRRERGVA